MTTAHNKLTTLTTMIGSLPQPNIDSALEIAFQVGIPFLPQIPQRNPWEYMIPQALEGLPGLEIDPEGQTFLNRDVWQGRTRSLAEKLDHFFASQGTDFEPSAAASSSWQAFLWELTEQKKTLAKIQLAGPLTSQWSLRLSDGTPADRIPELSAQILRLVLARSISMVRRLKQEKIETIFFIDEPALYGLNLEYPRHRLGLEELKFFVKTLKNEGAWVGLHCCSNTLWLELYKLGLHYLSIDVKTSLDSILSQPQELKLALKSGLKLSLGFELDVHWKEVKERLIQSLGQELTNKICQEALLTPACGLALHTPEEAQWNLAHLHKLDTLRENS